jgi:hypothetical protein
MKSALKFASLIVMAAVLALWTIQGSNTGWTQTQQAIPYVDEITGIESVNYVDRLSIGVEVLALGIGVALALFVLSLFLKPKSKKTS